MKTKTEMKTKKLLMTVAALIFPLSFSSCVVGSVEMPTRGQELIDLKKARDVKAITPSEYDAEKRKVMDVSKIRTK
ncbi:MAG: hypothetical protein ACK56K_11210 [Akkermansiaceae bacterium]|jgi:hypothetical protein